MIETCVLSVLMYGCENWVLTEVLYSKLDKFLGELAKKWPKHLSNMVARTVLDVESSRSYVFGCKLSFLMRLVRESACWPWCKGIAEYDDLESVCLVKEYWELEEWCGLKFVDEILVDRGAGFSLREIKDRIRTVDREKTLALCAEKAPLVERIRRGCGWLVLWDKVLDRGWKHIRGLQAVSQVLAHHGHGQGQPLVQCRGSSEGTLWSHLLDKHRMTLKLDDNYFYRQYRGW